MLAARPDRFSQLLSRLLKDEPTGQYVVTSSGLTKDEWAEMRALAEKAHAGFRTELSEAIERLRQLLGLGDPLYVATMLQLSNLFGGFGTYYEPTHEGMESRVELVVGLLATQPIAGTSGEPTDNDMQCIYDEIDHILEVLLVYNVSKPRSADYDLAMLEGMGAMRWMTMRGSSYADHGQDLARAVYGPHDEWMLATYGFTIDDVIDLGLQAQSLINGRVNKLLDQARTFADDVLKHLQSEDGKHQLTAEVKKQLSTGEGRSQLGGLAFIDVLKAGLREALTLSADDLCPPSDALRRERFEAALKELAIGVGSLDPSAYTGLYDESPFTDRPLLEFGGRYLLVIPGMVLRDPVALLEDRLKSHFLEGSGESPRWVGGQVPERNAARLGDPYESVVRGSRTRWPGAVRGHRLRGRGKGVGLKCSGSARRHQPSEKRHRRRGGGRLEPGRARERIHPQRRRQRFPKRARSRDHDLGRVSARGHHRQSHPS